MKRKKNQPSLFCEVQGMPQNIYTQIIGALVHKYSEGEIQLTNKELNAVEGCVIFFDGKLTIRSSQNGKE